MLERQVADQLAHPANGLGRDPQVADLAGTAPVSMRRRYRSEREDRAGGADHAIVPGVDDLRRGSDRPARDVLEQLALIAAA